MRPRELDFVEFLVPVGEWPAGTRGTVISEYGDSALVEVSTEMHVDEEGLPLRDLFDDLVDVDYVDLRVVEPARASVE